MLGDGTADGSEALQIAPVYAEQRALHVVRVCYHAAPKVVRGAGQGREAAGDVAARARLGRCDGRPASAEQVPRYALERDVPVSDDAVGDDSLQLFELPADFPLGLFPVDLVGRQAQADAQRAGQVGQMQVAGQRAFPAGDRLGQYRLGHAERNGRPVHDGPEAEMLAEARQHLLVDERFHLERDAGQRDEHAAVALEPHAGSRSAAVRQYDATVGHERLSLIQLVEIDMPQLGHPAYLLVDGFVAHERHAEHACERMFRDVVFRRAEAAGADHDVGALQRLADGLLYVPGSIGDRRDPVDSYARRVELLAQPGRVRVDDLSDQDFVAYGNDFCLHQCVMIMLRKRCASEQRRGCPVACLSCRMLRQRYALVSE